MQTRVQKWGSSLGVRIPRGLAEEVGALASKAWLLVAITITLAPALLAPFSTRERKALPSPWPCCPESSPFRQSLTPP